MQRAIIIVCASAMVLLAWHPSARARTPRGFGNLGVTGGGDLALETLTVKATVEGATARTEIIHVFRNRMHRDVEGVFRTQLPEGAAIVRLAMDVNGRMMEGELVEAERGRRIYDEIVAAKVDPALLEDKGDGRYDLSIFPIPARGTKTVVLTYEELVDGEYRFPLPRLGAADRAIGRFNFSLTVDGASRARVAKRGFRPRRSLRYALPEASSGSRVASTARGRFALIDVRPRIPAAADATPPATVFAIDTSRSMAAGFRRTRARVRTLVRRATKSGARVAMVYGDLAASSCADASIARCLAGLDTGGASNLEALLRTAVAVAGRFGGAARIVLVSDGVASLGAQSSAELAATVRKHAGTMDISLHAVALGARPDLGFLGSLTDALGGRVHGSGNPAQIWRAIETPLITNLRAESTDVDDLAVVGPRSIAPGQAVRVVGRLRAASGLVRLRGSYRGRDVSMSVAVSSRREARASMVERFWARHHIAELQRRGVPKRQIVALSLRHGVMSAHTSFLVLETARDYQRRGIARTTSRRNRRELGAMEGKVVRGGRRLTARKAARTPQVRIGNSVAMGDLDKSLIRRVVRQRRNRLRYCYERAMLRSPRLSGRVVLSLTIAASGAVTSAGIQSSEVGHEAMERCIVAAARRMRFPSVPGGGVIHVRYPFHFSSPQAAAPSARDARDEIKILESLGPRTSLSDQRRLLTLYLRAKLENKADAYYRTLAKKLDSGGNAPVRLLGILTTPELRARYASDFRRAGMARLRTPHASNELLGQLFASYARDVPSAIPAIFGPHAVPRWEARSMLDQLTDGGQAVAAAALVAAWLQHSTYDDDAIYDILSYTDDVAGSLARELYAVTLRIARRPDPPERVVDALVETATAIGQSQVAANVVIRQCRTMARHVSEDPCPRWLRATASQPVVRALLRDRLTRLGEQRRKRPGDPQLIRAHAATLMALGRDRRAARLLSEIVEHTPRDPAARQMYRDALQDPWR